MWEKRKPDCKINLISFSNPKYLFTQHFNSLSLNNVNVIDFYSTTEENDSFIEKLNEYFETNTTFDTVVINCLSTLSLSIGLEKAVLFIEKIKEKSKQLIGIYRRDFGRVNLPNVETMATTYVKLDGHSKATQINDFIYVGNYTHRKPGGSIVHQSELVTQNIKTYEITSSKICKESVEKLRKTVPEKPKEVKASFRIEMNDQEMSQKNETPLPYIEVKNPNKSTIFYQLEDFDDDEGDDLDDDLEI